MSGHWAKRGQISLPSILLTTIVVVLVLGSLAQINIQVQKSDQVLAAPSIIPLPAPTQKIYTFDPKDPSTILDSGITGDMTTWLKYFDASYRKYRLDGQSIPNASDFALRFVSTVLKSVHTEDPNKYKQLVSSKVYGQLVKEIYANLQIYVPIHNDIANSIKLLNKTDKNWEKMASDIESQHSSLFNAVATLKADYVLVPKFTDDKLKQLCLNWLKLPDNLDQASGCETFNLDIKDPRSVLKNVDVSDKDAPGEANTWLKYLNKIYSEEIINSKIGKDEKKDENSIIDDVLPGIFYALSLNEGHQFQLSRLKSLVSSSTNRKIGNEIYANAQIFAPFYNKAVNLPSVDQRSTYLKDNIEKDEKKSKINTNPIPNLKLVLACLQVLKDREQLSYGEKICGNLEEEKVVSPLGNSDSSQKQPVVKNTGSVQLCNVDIPTTGVSSIDNYIHQLTAGERKVGGLNCDSVTKQDIAEKTITAKEKCNSIQEDQIDEINNKDMANKVKFYEQDSGTCLKSNLVGINFPVDNSALSFFTGGRRTRIQNIYVEGSPGKRTRYTEEINLIYKNGLVSLVSLSDTAHPNEIRKINFVNLIDKDGKATDSSAKDILSRFKFDESGYDYALFYSFLKERKVNVEKIGLPDPDDLKMISQWSNKKVSLLEIKKAMGRVSCIRNAVFFIQNKMC